MKRPHEMTLREFAGLKPRTDPERRLIAEAERIQERERWFGYLDGDDEALADGLDALVRSGLVLTGAERDFIDRALANFEAFGFLDRPDLYEDLTDRICGISRATDARDRARGILQNRIDQVLALRPRRGLVERLTRRSRLGSVDCEPLPF